MAKSIMYKVRNPGTDEIEEHTPQNAHDLVQHLKWQIVGRVGQKTAAEDKAEMQEKIDQASINASGTGAPGSTDGDDDGEHDA